MMKYETVIGLEVHVHLKTQTKAFCGCSTEFGKEPNSHTCPVCLGFPGSLPVLNEKALEYAVKVALGLNSEVQEYIKFDRKNYFYPDLPKNYQISQYDMPVGLGGAVDIEVEGVRKTIRVKRVHLEEDAGKLIHKEGSNYSLVDFNRGGIPLLEIVSEPDISSPEEAFEYLKNLKLIVQYLGVSDCDMEKGSLRCDANISLRPQGQKELGVKAEIKNMNSFKGVRDALTYEVKRQTEVLSENGKIVQETRLWDDVKGMSYSMRSKEEAHDYRYFPDPDLVPFTFTKEFINEIKNSLGESPHQKLDRYINKLGFSSKEAQLLVSDRDLNNLFEECIKIFPDTRKIFNWLSGSFLGYVNEGNKDISQIKLDPKELVKLIQYMDSGKLSNLTSKKVFIKMLDTGKSVDEIIKDEGLVQVSNEGELEVFIDKVIKDNPKSVADFLAGKENAVMYLVGQTMQQSRGKANPKIVKEILIKKLKSNEA